MKRLVMIIGLALSPAPAMAEMPIEIVPTAEDSVGKRFVYAIKEKVRQSNSMSITLDDSSARMQAQIVTLERDPSNPGLATVYSVVLTWDNPDQPFPFFLTQYTGYCGASRVDSCADEMVAELSEQSDALIRMFIEASKE